MTKDKEIGLGSIVKQMAKDVFERCDLFLIGLSGATGMHVLPTYYRLGKKLDEKMGNYEPKIEGLEMTLPHGAVIGAFPYLMFYGYQIMEKRDFKVLLIPVATNAISGMYEWYRSAKKRSQLKEEENEKNNIHE